MLFLRNYGTTEENDIFLYSTWISNYILHYITEMSVGSNDFPTMCTSIGDTFCSGKVNHNYTVRRILVEAANSKTAQVMIMMQSNSCSIEMVVSLAINCACYFHSTLLDFQLFQNRILCGKLTLQAPQ